MFRIVAAIYADYSMKLMYDIIKYYTKYLTCGEVFFP